MTPARRTTRPRRPSRDRRGGSGRRRARRRTRSRRRRARRSGTRRRSPDRAPLRVAALVGRDRPVAGGRERREAACAIRRTSRGSRAGGARARRRAGRRRSAEKRVLPHREVERVHRVILSSLRAGSARTEQVLGAEPRRPIREVRGGGSPLPVVDGADVAVGAQRGEVEEQRRPRRAPRRAWPPASRRPAPPRPTRARRRGSHRGARSARAPIAVDFAPQPGRPGEAVGGVAHEREVVGDRARSHAELARTPASSITGCRGAGRAAPRAGPPRTGRGPCRGCRSGPARPAGRRRATAAADARPSSASSSTIGQTVTPSATQGVLEQRELREQLGRRCPRSSCSPARGRCGTTRSRGRWPRPRASRPARASRAPTPAPRGRPRPRCRRRRGATAPRSGGGTARRFRRPGGPARASIR